MPDMSNDADLMQHKIDITNCDREPIHVPASIQPHGVLFTLNEPDLVVEQASSNVGEYLGLSDSEVLGNPVSLFLGESQAESLRQTLTAENLTAVNPIKLMIGAGPRARMMNGIVHRHQGILFLELEPCEQGTDASLRAFQGFQAALTRLQATTSLTQLWRTISEEVKAILHFDRVMVYKFDPEGNGEVIEEQVVEGRESYLGLHYPASDIPRQARRLYTINLVRHIPDVSYQPSQLVPLIYPPSRELTDMSFCTLRSVSPIHVEYLQNMGVAASLSISLLKDNALWGLIACHNYTPKFVQFELRAACEMLGQVVSLRLAGLESIEEAQFRSHSNTMQARFLEALSSKVLREALIAGSPNVLDFIPADGAALCLGKQCFTVGAAPTSQQIDRLIKRIRRSSSPLFVTDHLSSIYAEGGEMPDVASGVLCSTISRDKNIYLLWFRGEQIQTVNWAGNPDKAVEESGERLRPRGSFALWKEQVRNKSLSWTPDEIRSATELRSTISGLLLQKE